MQEILPEPGRRQTDPVRRQDFGCYSQRVDTIKRDR